MYNIPLLLDMELISLGKDVLQNIAEHAASYRMGQSVLRQLDRVLWVVEKCARWAVPPPCKKYFLDGSMNDVYGSMVGCMNLGTYLITHYHVLNTTLSTTRILFRKFQPAKQ